MGIASLLPLFAADLPFYRNENKSVPAFRTTPPVLEGGVFGPPVTLWCMRTIGITGANGFLGSALAAAFATEGQHVVGFCRSQRSLKSPAEMRHFDLRSPISTASLTGLDVLVHAAYVPAPGARGEDVNLNGSIGLFSAAREAGVRKLVFISSMAAMPDSASAYGRSKHAIEQHLDRANDLIIRPGLIIGDGGLFRSMYESIRRHGIAPVFEGGAQPVYTISISELRDAIVKLVFARSAGVYTLAYSEPTPMSELYRLIARRADRKLRLVRLPLRTTLLAIGVLESAGISLPITSENLKGIANLRVHDVRDTQMPGLRFASTEDTIRELVVR